MCRRNQLIGWILVAFGIGLLVGLRLESGFLCNCIGLCCLGCGFHFMRKR